MASMEENEPMLKMSHLIKGLGALVETLVILFVVFDTLVGILKIFGKIFKLSENFKKSHLESTFGITNVEIAFGARYEAVFVARFQVKCVCVRF